MGFAPTQVPFGALESSDAPAEARISSSPLQCKHGIAMAACGYCKPKGPPVSLRPTTAAGDLPSGPIATDRGLDSYPRYAKWNREIGKEFFSGRWQGLPVYLDFSFDTLITVAGRVGIDTMHARADFVDAVASTLSFGSARGGIFGTQRDLLRRWTQTAREEPPWCVALLALLSLAAEDMARDEQLSANNYYGRLCQLLGVTDEAIARKLQNDFRSDTHTFWDALNSWLEDTERIYGRPTAFAFDRRRHVGIPISQALLKEHDRAHLREFFHAYRLSPRQRLALPELTRLLEHWLPSSSVSKGLKTLWRQPEARERIATVAQLELEAWDGQLGIPDGHGAHEASLLLVGHIREHPTPRLGLAVRVRRLESIPRAVYRLPVQASQAAQEAFRAVRGAINVEDTQFDDWLEIPESCQISIPDLLLTSLELYARVEPSFRLTRPLRRLIPLKLDVAQGLLIEVSRVELGEPYFLLVHKSLGADLDSFLARIAIAGYRRWSPAALRGLPEDWLAFWRVTIAQSAESPLPDLSILTPIATTHTVLDGGFTLQGRMTWHISGPPQVRVTALDEGDVRVSLAVSQALDGKDPDPPRILGVFAQAALIDLSAVDPPLVDGDYRVEVDRGEGESSESVASIGFRLRSGDHPRPVQMVTIPALSHVIASSGLGVMSATPQPGDGSYTARGAVIDPTPAAEAPVHASPIPLPPARPGSPGLVDPNSESPLTEQGTRATSQAPPCLDGGHLFKLPYYSPGRQPPPQIHRSCVNCGLEKWFYPRRRHHQQPSGACKIVATRSLAGPASQNAMERGAATWDNLLDALTYGLGGSWESFESLAGQLDDEAWFPLEAARALSALGHIDIELQSANLRPRAWSLSPPTLLACSQPGEAFLCGARPPWLIRELCRAVERIGGEFSVESNLFGPSTVRILVLDPADLQVVARSLGTTRGLLVTIAERVPERLLSVLPPLRELLQQLQSISWPAATIETFNTALGKWLPTPEPDSPGVYRFGGQPWIYAFVSLDDLPRRRARLTEARFAKYLAASIAGQSLLGYHRESQSLLTPWGAQLPGLYERVAVLCSGTPPIKLVDGSVRYPGVPPHLASRLWRLLGEARP